MMLKSHTDSTPLPLPASASSLCSQCSGHQMSSHASSAAHRSPSWSGCPLLLVLSFLVFSLACWPLAVHAVQCDSSVSGLPVYDGSMLNFTQLPPQGTWTVESPTIAATVAPITGPGGVYPAGSWLWWAGGQPAVFLSSDSAQSWTQMQYEDDYGQTEGSANCAARASSNAFYVLTTNGTGPYVWYSTDGQQWQSVLNANSTLAFNDTRQTLQWTGCVVDSSDRLYSVGASDVWVSSDRGVSFVAINSSTPWATRFGFGLSVFSTLGGEEAIVLLGGALPHYAGVLNDVWASTTYGATWLLVTAAAPWSQRAYFAFTTSASGAMVLQGGSANGPLLDDVWLSLDGGFTWAEVATSTIVSPRTSSGSIVDAQGFIYAFAGQSADYTWNNDGYKSTLSLSNAQLWLPIISPGTVIPDGYQLSQPYLSYDGLVFTGFPSSTGPAQLDGYDDGGVFTLAVDLATNRLSVSRDIFGFNQVQDQTVLTSSMATVNRLGGGDAASTYNWTIDADSGSGDFFYQNRGDTSNGVNSRTPALLQTVQAGAKAILDIPIIGWVVKDTVCYSFPITRFPGQAQTECDYFDNASFCDADIGNGYYPNGTGVAWVHGAQRGCFVESGPEKMIAWIDSLRTATGPEVFDEYVLVQMDNEPEWWYEEHQDIHPSRLRLRRDTVALY